MWVAGLMTTPDFISSSLILRMVRCRLLFAFPVDEEGAGASLGKWFEE